MEQNKGIDIKFVFIENCLNSEYIIFCITATSLSSEERSLVQQTLKSCDCL